MIIVYCETCGVRVSEEAVNSGQAMLAGENKYYCDKCAPVSSPTLNRKSPGGSNRLAALMQKAAAAQAPGSHSRNRAAKPEKPADPLWMYLAGGALMIAGAVYFFVAARPQNPTKVSQAAKPTSATQPTTTTPAKTQTSKETPVSNQTKTQPPNLARMPDSDPDLERLRFQRGLNLVEEARAWAKANPNDPWGYKDRLTMVLNIYRSTPAAEEASKLLAALKLPEGPRPGPVAAATPATGATPAAPTFAPSAAGDGWEPIFNGKTHPFRGNAESWRVENGVLIAQERVTQQTEFSFSDGDVRLRLTLQDSSYFEMYVRQSSPGYHISMDRRVLEPLWGKPMEILFSCKGPEVTATLNGQPLEVRPGSRPQKGMIQLNNVSGTARIYAFEYRAAKK